MMDEAADVVAGFLRDLVAERDFLRAQLAEARAALAETTASVVRQ